MPPKRRFSEEDLQRIQAAVAVAEGGTSGEIVPVFVEASDRYGEAPWRAGALLGLLGYVADFFFSRQNGSSPFSPSWPSWQPVLAFAACSFVGFFATHFSPPLLRLFTRKESMSARVALRAEAAFTREQVFATRDRTGILIFISFLERQVRVIADAGIHAKVPDGTWDSVVEKVVHGMKEGRPADGVIEAITLCGQLLRQHGFAARPDDTNELSDSLRVE